MERNNLPQAREFTPTRVPSHHAVDPIEHTLAGISSTLEQALFADQIARQKGFLQSLDARMKLVALLGLLIAVSLSHQLAVLAGLYLLALVLAGFSAVPLGFFIRRVWLMLPFFTGIIAIPALFLSPGPTLLKLPLGWVITQTGATSAAFLLFRVATSVSLAVLLVLTTPWNRVLKALTVLGIPEVVVLVLGMTYRYIYLLLRVVNDMFLSRRSRTIQRLNGPEQRRVLAAAGGTLLAKSLDLSGEVYLAMQSRGFRGTPQALEPLAMRPLDWVCACGAGVIAAAAIVLGR